MATNNSSTLNINFISINQYIIKNIKYDILITAVVEILSKGLGNVGGLGRSQRLVIDSDEEGLLGLHQVHTSLALLTSLHLIK